MAKINFVTKDNLLYVWQKIKLLLSNKVDKVEGKGLSTNDLTDELKNKILNAGDSSFSGNYNDLTNKPDLTIYETKTGVATAIADFISESDIDVKITNATKDMATTGDVTNTITTSLVNYYTKTQTNTAITNATKDLATKTSVTTSINNAVKDIVSFNYSVVASLPATGNKGTIYLISNNGSGNNIYDEYIYVNNKFEKIGTTEIDLSSYVKAIDLVAITNEEIDEIFAS